MAEIFESHQGSDPSANVTMFVGNAVKYLEDLHKSEERSIDEKLKLHFEYTRRESDAESARINALRDVDVQAVAIANERAVKQAEVLATQVATSAEALRILVAQTATTIAQQLALVTSQLIERIAALEKVQYENQGKSGASSNLLDRVADLETSKYESKGRAGISTPLLMLLSSLGGGIIIFIIESLIR